MIAIKTKRMIPVSDKTLSKYKDAVNNWLISMEKPIIEIRLDGLKKSIYINDKQVLAYADNEEVLIYLYAIKSII